MREEKSSKTQASSIPGTSRNDKRYLSMNRQKSCPTIKLTVQAMRVVFPGPLIPTKIGPNVEA